MKIFYDFTLNISSNIVTQLFWNHAVKYIDETPYIRLDVLMIFMMIFMMLAVLLRYVMFWYSKLLSSSNDNDIGRISKAGSRQQTSGGGTLQQQIYIAVENSCIRGIYIYSSPHEDITDIFIDLNNDKTFTGRKTDIGKP